MSSATGLQTHSVNVPDDVRSSTGLRRWIDDAVNGLISWSPVVARRLMPRQHFAGFGILMYHRIAEKQRGVPAPTYNVTPARFRAQIAGLLSRGFTPWPLRKTLEFHGEGRTIPPRVFVVTFDDGYENVYRDAWPVLREFNVPATIFLATAYLDSVGPFPFDDWPATGRPSSPPLAWRPLRTEHCREMADSGLVELGAHTHTHADFRGEPELLETDLGRCVEILRDRFGLADVTFSFPFGGTRLGFAGPELAQAARRTGVLCSLTTDSGLIETGQDPFEWGRFTAAQSDTAATLAAKLDGTYSRLRNVWRTIR